MDEVIRRFNEQGVRYLLIGGQAVRLEGFPRFSMDWDFFVPCRDQGNLDRINRALGEELDSGRDLLAAKEAVGWAQDAADIELLRHKAELGLL